VRDEIDAVLICLANVITQSGWGIWMSSENDDGMADRYGYAHNLWSLFTN